jgi:hypothetical protein
VSSPSNSRLQRMLAFIQRRRNDSSTRQPP